MPRRPFRILLLAAAFAAAPLPAAELEDDRGISVSVPASASRIAALSPHLVEIAFAAGAGSRLAAAVRYSDYPQAAARLPRVGDASRFDIERILALRPDLVLGWKSGNPAPDLARLERLGLPVFVTEPARLRDIPRLIRIVGALAGTQPSAEEAAATLERDFEDLRQRYAARPPVRVFYEIWHRPLLTVSGEHLISDVIALCGGVNVFAQAPVLTPAVSLEAIVAARPDVVLGGSSAARPQDFPREWHASAVTALRNLPVRYVPPDVIQRQTPRIVEGARVICEHLDQVRQRR